MGRKSGSNPLHIFLCENAETIDELPEIPYEDSVSEKNDKPMSSQVDVPKTSDTPFTATLQGFTFGERHQDSRRESTAMDVEGLTTGRTLVKMLKTRQPPD
eukprot:PhF_6_TR13847/c0_g2_i1/m.22201